MLGDAAKKEMRLGTPQSKVQYGTQKDVGRDPRWKQKTMVSPRYATVREMNKKVSSQKETTIISTLCDVGRRLPQKFMVLGRNLEWETNVSNSCLSVVGGGDSYAPLYGPEANDLVWICGTERRRRQTGRILDGGGGARV